MSRKSFDVHVTKDVSLNDFVASAGLAADGHVLWDVSLPNHSFVLERVPSGGQNMILQSYQAAYNVQFWLGLEPERCDEGHRNDFQSNRDQWHEPSNAQVGNLAGEIDRLINSDSLAERQGIWGALPFNQHDPWNLTGVQLVTINRFDIKPPFTELIAKEALLSALAFYDT